MIPLFLAMLTGMILTESATKTSYSLPGLPRTMPLIYDDDLYFFNLEIWTLFIISVTIFGAGMFAGGSAGVGEGFLGGGGGCSLNKRFR